MRGALRLEIYEKLREIAKKKGTSVNELIRYQIFKKLGRPYELKLGRESPERKNTFVYGSNVYVYLSIYLPLQVEYEAKARSIKISRIASEILREESESVPVRT